MILTTLLNPGNKHDVVLIDGAPTPSLFYLSSRDHYHPHDLSLVACPKISPLTVVEGTRAVMATVGRPRYTCQDTTTSCTLLFTTKEGHPRSVMLEKRRGKYLYCKDGRILVFKTIFDFFRALPNS